MRCVVALAATTLLLAVAMPPATVAYRTEAGDGALAADAPLPAATLADIATRKATCPFIGSIVAQGLLGIGGDLNSPVALVNQVVALGNSGRGSTLGYVLKLFATGNHAFTLTPATQKLTTPVPVAGGPWFALDFPGSQGSHAGHSGILQGDWRVVNSGRWSATNFARLTAKAQGGLLTVKAIGEFIAENIKADPASRTVTSGGLLSVLLPDSVKLLGSVGTSLLSFLRNPSAANAATWRSVTVGLTKLLGDDNLIGSAGEFGLLLAFLEKSGNTKRTASGDVGFSVAEITSMFRDHRLPAGWNAWTKSGLSWVKFTSQLSYHARHRLNDLKF